MKVAVKRTGFVDPSVGFPRETFLMRVPEETHYSRLLLLVHIQTTWGKEYGPCAFCFVTHHVSRKFAEINVFSCFNFRQQSPHCLV